MKVVKDAYAVGSYDWTRNKIREKVQADEDGADIFVRDIFQNFVILEIEYYNPMKSLLARIDYSITGSDITLGQPQEVSVEYVQKARKENKAKLADIELVGPIVRKDAKKRIAYVAVLIPGEADSDGDILSAEKIEEVAHEYMLNYRAIDVMHSFKKDASGPVESYLTPVDRQVNIMGEEVILPKGSWIQATKVSEGAWKEIESGDLVGYSIGAFRNADLEKAVKSGEMPEMKRITLTDLGDGDPNGEWSAAFVSLVNSPAVPKAKFFALKSCAPKKSLWERITKTEKQEDDDMKEEDVKALLDEKLADVSAKSDEVSAKIVALEASIKEMSEKAAEKAEEDKEKEEAPVEETEEVKAMKAENEELKTKLTELEAGIKELKDAIKPESKQSKEGDDNGGDYTAKSTMETLGRNYLGVPKA